MMKISDKALQLIGRKLLNSMEASSDRDSSTATLDSTLEAHKRALSLGLRKEQAPEKARILLFRGNGTDD